jgi:aromatic ring-opening dioxygenase LigB subunit
MPQVLPHQEENLRTESTETKVIATDIEMPAANIAPGSEKQIIVITPAHDFGGGSAVARVRVKPREA